jgi:hypothetical protein
MYINDFLCYGLFQEKAHEMLIDELALYLHVMNVNFIQIQCWLVEEEIDLWITTQSLGKDEIQMFAHDIFSFLYNRGGQHQNEINVSTSKLTMYCDLVNTIV